MKHILLIGLMAMFTIVPSSRVELQDEGLHGLETKSSIIVDYDESAFLNVLSDPNCSIHKLESAAKCACYLSYILDKRTPEGDAECLEAFQKDPSQLQACGSFMDNGELDTKAAVQNLNNVSEGCVSKHVNKDSFILSAVRSTALRYPAVRCPWTIVIIVIIIIVLFPTELGDAELRYSPMPSDAFGMERIELAKQYGPKVARILS